MVDAVGPRLRVFMRSHGAENDKGRPDFYDKTSCLASVIRAAQALGPAAELVFVNDGPLPADRERLMASFGEVVQVELGSNRASYRSTLALAASRDHGAQDLVWFAEDDYLYRPDAFVELMRAAAELPAVDYFSMYVGELQYRPPTNPSADLHWLPATSTTSSFAVRHGALVQDLGLLRLMPFTGGAFDHTTCLTLQGRYPFTFQELREDLLPVGSWAVGDWPRAVTRGVVRAALGSRALRRPSRRRKLYCPDRDLITHLELGAFDPAEDWAALAGQSRSWVAERLDLESPTAGCT